MNKPKSVGFLLFKDFEVLDVFGPLEMFGLLPDQYTISTVSERGGVIKSAQGPGVVADFSFNDPCDFEILMVPGGSGTRTEVDNQLLLDWLCKTCECTAIVASVCTGSVLLAKAGLLNGFSATTNKGAFSWVASHGANTDWKKEARWVEDGRYFTSSGVSAGMDMSLAIIAKHLGHEAAEQVSVWAEYDWHKDANWDPFASIRGLVD